MTISFTKVRSLVPTPSRIIVNFGRHAGKIFLIGLMFFSFFGIALFYFFGYRFTQRGYESDRYLQGVNRGLLTQVLKQLQGQQSKTQNPPSVNPFE